MGRASDPRQLRVLSLFGGVAKLGAERANLEALSALRAGGAEVLLMVSDAPWAREIREDIAAQGFPIRACPYLLLPRPERRVLPWVHYPPTILRASLALLRAAAAFRPTHLQAGSQLFVLNFLPALAVLRTPLVYRCGDRPVVHHGLYRAVWRFILGRTARFVAVSRFIADDLVASGADPDAVEVIYSRPPARRPDRADPPRPTPGLFTIVFVGQVSEAKGCRVLVDAFRRLAPEFPAARLVIAGRISEWAGDAWARALREETLADPALAERVRFPGFVEDVPGLLAAADLHVAPTLTEEPLANVVMEAKQAGVPSVVFPSGGLPEVVEHGVDGWVCAERTADSLREALRGYLSAPGRATQQGPAARASLVRLGVDQFEARWRQVYERAGITP